MVSYVKKQKGIYGMKFTSLSGFYMLFCCSLELMTLTDRNSGNIIPLYTRMFNQCFQIG